MSDRSRDDLFAEVFGVNPAMSSSLLKTPLSLHAHANHISFLWRPVDVKAKFTGRCLDLFHISVMMMLLLFA